jgi:hypothetical protein
MLRNKNLGKVYLFIFTIIWLCSCSSIRLISDYDEITDKAVTELQDKVSRYFVKLSREIGTDKAKYENYVEFFDEAKVDLNNLKIRADAIDKNEITQKIVGELTNMVNTTEQLHQIGFNNKLEIVPIQKNFNVAFTAIIKFQMALKRGEKTN